MPKRTDINTILVIGAGPIVIGQACEFDYSGTQACKVLKKENYRVVLINSNPATIMTDPEIADAIYIEPITLDFIKKIIEKEKPDALLPTMGGQVALNCAIELNKQGSLEKYQIKLLGADINTIENAEDRKKFKLILKKLNLNTPQSAFIHSMDEAKEIINAFSFPVILRPSFTLGGSGGGIAHDLKEYLKLCQHGLDLSPIKQVMIDESLVGWKEYELEVMRDKNNNCSVICTIENLDPMGIHTGDSITVAPAMTLTDQEFQKMRSAAFHILDAVGLETGGANIQFAIHPTTGKRVVIEMNPRVSRSSALASKATGYPIAKIATQLAIGYTLPELQNEITGKFPAAFEPVLDYVVVKIPRFNFDKFPEEKNVLTTQMKSIGEVMALGRTFQEALQKAIQSLEINCEGLDNGENLSEKQIREKLGSSDSKRLWSIATAFRYGFDINEIHQITQIDPWFLSEIQDLIQFESVLSTYSFTTLDKKILLKAKRKGFSDKRIAQLIHCQEENIFLIRKKFSILPTYKKVDTCAAEFQAESGYFYSCYEEECEAEPSNNKKVIVIGSGPNRIGQGIEFDYACVHALQAIKSLGLEAIIINCNPETVSTDYDIADKLYFEPLTHEHVFSIIEKEKPLGVITQLGGQTSLKLANTLNKLGLPLIGTSAENTNIAEDRELFRKILFELQLKQSKNITFKNKEHLTSAPLSLNFPIIARPSHILGGQAMRILKNQDELNDYVKHDLTDENAYPLLIEEFLEDAIEVDVDAISDGEEVHICGLLEHIEPAGIHSGDSACQFPSTLPDALQEKLIHQTQLLSKSLKIKGFLNVQFAIKNNDIFVIEANPRASRTLPFLSKATHVPWAKLGTLCMLGEKIKNFSLKINNQKKFSIKEAVFPFNKFPQADFILGPQMKSTGEVMASDFCHHQAFLKAQLAAGYKINYQPGKNIILLNYKEKHLGEIINLCLSLKLNLFADNHTAEILKNKNISFSLLKNKDYSSDDVIAILFLGEERSLLLNSVMKKAIHDRTYYASTHQAAIRLLQGLRRDL